VPFAAALSEHPLPAEAAGEVLGQILESLPAEPDLAVLFATAPMTGALEDVVGAVHAVLRPRTLIGSTAVSVLAGGQEVEETTALTLWAGTTGPTTPVRLEAVRDLDDVVVGGLPDDIAPGSTLVLLTDPFTFPADAILPDLAASGVTVIGGLASAARGPGGNRLVLDHEVHTEGAVGVLLPPDRAVVPLVSQGCRPVGEPMIVTKAERNIVYELAGQPALDRVLGLATAASPEERTLMQAGLHVGVVVDEAKDTFERGDFLVRGVLGADRSNGAVAIGEEVEIGTTIQFHVRDAGTADEDLREMLGASGTADGALVFSCNGRGTNLFGRPNHDAELVAEITRGRCAGMFCAGEIGPVGHRSFLHGFTASVALFREN
jgi:small ligand-binding sensory domain FIST